MFFLIAFIRQKYFFFLLSRKTGLFIFVNYGHFCLQREIIIIMAKTSKNNKVKDAYFFALVAERIRHFEKLGKGKTAGNCACALKHFMKFRKGKDISVGELSVSEMKDFQSYLTGEGLKMNTISLYNRMLNAAYNHALDEEIIMADRRPFRKNFTGQEKTRKRTLNERTVRRLIGLDLTADRALEFARDMFLFSIYMQGMPFVDIARLTKVRLRRGHITYQRSKTNRRLTVAVHPRAQAIIDKWQVGDPDCPYLFPILCHPEKRKVVRYDSALRTHNKRLAKLSEMLKLEQPLSSYVARHTWASLARKYGVQDNIISEAMGHNHITTTMIYLASLDVEVIATANRKVINHLVQLRI